MNGRECRRVESYRQQGLSLVELLISLLLLGTITLSFGILLFKSKITITSLGMKAKSAVELEQLFLKIRKDLESATWIDASSHSKKILFTMLDANGNTVSTGYRITTSGGKTVLQTLSNGNWISPYSISSDTGYNLDGAPKFIYCGAGNDCTDFTDANDDGTKESTALLSGYTGTALGSPSQASKVLLDGFSFNRQQGNPPVSRQWADTLIALPDYHVSASTVLLQSFATNTAGNFSAGFKPYGAYYDTDQERLLLTGGSDTSGNNLYIVSRDGVRLQAIAASAMSDVCLTDDGNTALLVSNTSNNFYSANLSSGTVSSATALTGLDANSVSGISCDPVLDKFYTIGLVSSVPTIQERSVSAPNTITGTWTVPTSTGLTLPRSLSLDVQTGDFYTLDATVSGTPKLIKLFHVTRAAPASPDVYSINITTLGSSTTSASSPKWWGVAFDPGNNHGFLVDYTSNLVYEFIPPRLFSPRS